MHAVSFQPTVADMLSAYRAWYVATLKKRATVIRYGVFLTVGAIAGAMLGQLYAIWALPLGAAIGAAYVAAILGVLLVVSYLLLPMRVRSAFKQQRTLHCEHHVTWTDETFTVETSRGVTSYAWSDFIRLLEGREAVLLFQSDLLFNFIPKRSLTREQTDSLMRHAGEVAA